MKLLRLRLENFRQHMETDLEFQSGMTAITGPNGSGKSTLVEAITFALYGEQRDKKESVRFHWGKGRRFSVTLWFELGGRTYEVERTHADAHLLQGSVLRAHGLTETTRACERLLSLSYDQFVNSFCAEQRQIAFLQFRTNAARQEEVARMLGFDRLRLAEELALQRRREAALRRETLERNLVPPMILIAQRREAESSFADAKRRLNEMCDSLVSVERQSVVAERERLDAERWLELDREGLCISAELAGLAAAAHSVASCLSQAEEAAAELDAVALGAARYREAEQRARDLEPVRQPLAQAEVLRTMAERLRAEPASAPDLAAPEQEAAAAEQQARKLDQGWSVERESASNALTSAQTRLEIAHLALAKAEVAAKEGRCPDCGQPIADARERLEARRIEVDRLSREVEGLCREVATLSIEPVNLTDARSRWQAAKTRLAEARAQASIAEEKQRRLLEVERQLSAIEGEYPGAGDEIERLQAVLDATRAEHERSLAVTPVAETLAVRREEHIRAQEALANARRRQRELDEEKSQYPFEDAASATTAIARAHGLAEEARTLRAALVHAESAVEGARRDLDLVKSRQVEQAALAEEVASLGQLGALHEACAREMRALRQELNADIGPDLAARASENLSLLTNGRYLALELDRNFGASVVEDGVAKPVISGGEEDVVALSLRLALSELIQERQGQPMSLLILDEVFGSLDVERRQAVLDRLTALRGRFQQILVITHLEDVHQVADQAIQLQRDPGSRATTVGTV